MKRNEMDEINRGHSIQVLKLEETNRNHFKFILPGDFRIPSNFYKNKNHKFFVLGTNTKQTNFNNMSTNLSDHKKGFLDEIGKVTINQKNNNTIIESDKSTNRKPQEQKGIKDMNKLTTPIMTSSQKTSELFNIVNNAEYFINKQKKLSPYNYINNLDKPKDNFNAASPFCVKDKFKKLKEKLTKINYNYWENNIKDDIKGLNKNKNNSNENMLNRRKITIINGDSFEFELNKSIKIRNKAKNKNSILNTKLNHSEYYSHAKNNSIGTKDNSRIKGKHIKEDLLLLPMINFKNYYNNIQIENGDR